MFDISVTTTAHQVENRSWQISQWGQGPGETPTIVLDVSAFTAGTHYPDGYIKSGEFLAKITATGLYGPYDSAATDGREVCAGLLHSSVKVPAATTTDVGAALQVMGVVREAKLPRAVTVTTAVKTALKLVHFV